MDLDTSNQSAWITSANYSDPRVAPRHLPLAFILSAFAAATFWGNTLVIAAVVCRPILHTPTGYLVLSLAVADLVVGLGVMPLNVVFELYDQVWLFSLTACDLWHSLDVLASTASIWNLCVIAVDRCLAVTDPLNYPQLMSVHRVCACIAAVWIGSALIAFPAVAWWRSASPELYIQPNRCSFTDDSGYLIFSSLLSFYVPLLIIVGAYGRVYMIASKHQRSLLEGRQPLPCNPSIYIRVHRGGQGASGTPSYTSHNGTSASDHHKQSIQLITGVKPDAQIPITQTPVILSRQDTFGQTTLEANVGTALKKNSRSSYGSYQSFQTHVRSSYSSAAVPSTRTSRSDSGFSHHSRRSRVSAVSMSSSVDGGNGSRAENKRRRKPRASLIVRLLAKESKAAKTLGIVVGAFIACWLPFFVVNVLSGACGKRCYLDSSSNDSGFRLTFTIVTWLGHCNSFLNPIIYTCFNREFRDAFAYVLLCGRWTGRGKAYAGRRTQNRTLISVNGQNFCARKGLAKAIEDGLRVIVPQITNSEATVVVSAATPSALTEEKEIEEEFDAVQSPSEQRNN